MSKRLISIFFVFIVIALVGLRAAFAPRMSAADEIVLSHQFAFSLIFIFLLCMWLGLEKWVACDANDRGLDSGRLWIMLARVLGLLDLIIYLYARPRGNLIPCASCGNKRLETCVKCPHCGIWFEGPKPVG